MDSAGNEVIIVDDRAQTNGFNGNYSEEVIAAAAAAASSEMKTRSKAIASHSSGPGEAAKLRSRAAANVANSHNNDKAPASPATVISASSNVSTSATSSSSSSAAAAASPSASASDKDKKMNLRSGVTDSQAESGSSKATSGDSAAAGGGKKNTVDGTAGPKSSKKGSGSLGDREDDSGINSRSSSVSTDDTYSSRLRTRSKRAEPLTSSTPASSAKKSASRMPLSTYDYDDDSMILHIEEDHSSSASSLKRKATKVVVEEMEDDEPAAGTAAEDDEPPVKVTVRRTSFFNVLLNPLKAFRGKIFYGSQIEEQDEKKAADNDDASQINVSKVNDEGSKTEYVASQIEYNSEASAATTATNENGKETPSTCMVM